MYTGCVFVFNDARRSLESNISLNSNVFDPMSGIMGLSIVYALYCNAVNRSESMTEIDIEKKKKIGVTQTSDVKFITIKYLLDFSMAHRVANTPAATFPSMSTGI